MVLCQLRASLFALFAAILCGTGCRESSHPELERLNTQLIQAAFDELATGEPDRAIKLLQRLGDTGRGAAFLQEARARERECRALLQFRALVRQGRFADARKLLDAEASHAGLSAQLGKASKLLPALAALSACSQSVRFAGSEQAGAALSGLAAYDAVLGESSTFRAWRREQQRAVTVLRASERAAVVRQLVCEYDLAVVAGDPAADTVLALLALEQPGHPLLRPPGRLLTAGRWDVSELGPAGGASGGTSADLEISACRHWTVLSGPTRDRLREITRDRQPVTLRRILLRVLLDSRTPDLGGAVARIRELAAVVPVSPAFLAGLLKESVMPPTQFRAGCWRCPFPSVTDYLTRLVQVREQQTTGGR